MSQILWYIYYTWESVDVYTSDGQLHSFFRAPMHTKWGLPPTVWVTWCDKHDLTAGDERRWLYSDTWSGVGRQNIIFSTANKK